MAANPAESSFSSAVSVGLPALSCTESRGLAPCPAKGLWPRSRTAGSGWPSGFTPSDPAQQEVRLPPKGPSVPAPQSGIPQGWSFLPTPILPADLSRRRGN